jgi:hypothetical protein
LFGDSLGIGLYPVDIHGHQDVPGAGQSTRPFQIPAAAMIQSQVRNLLPACKNIGTTHVTNGAYRLHPIEWAIGEAAGTFAALALSRRTDIVRLLMNKRALRELQDQLLNNGAPVYWFDDVYPEDEAFAAIQYLSITSIMPADNRSLSFRPDDALTRAELAESLARILRLAPVEDSACSIVDLLQDDPRYKSAQLCADYELMQVSENGNFEPDKAVTNDELKALSAHKLIATTGNIKGGSDPLTRSAFAVWLYRLAKEPRFFGRN